MSFRFLLFVENLREIASFESNCTFGSFSSLILWEKKRKKRIFFSFLIVYSKLKILISSCCFSQTMVDMRDTAQVSEVARKIPKEARRILHNLAAEWSDVDDSKALEVVQLKGAMTNEVYQINWPTSEEEATSRKVLVRIYGEGVDIFFNREDEIRTFECMSRHGQGPRLLGRFPNGRIEEFIHARVCTCAQNLSFQLNLYCMHDTV